MKIYTKTGDDGLTGLIGNTRIQKSSARIAAIGDVDEANATLGVCLSLINDKNQEVTVILRSAQSTLFELGAVLASTNSESKEKEAYFSAKISSLETSIDEMTRKVEPLRRFILPGGSNLAAQLHLARTVTRRAERSVWALNDLEPVAPFAMIFLNRLSDWLFTAARFANASMGISDVEWESES